MRSLIFAVFCLGFTACAVNPVTGEKELSIIPASQEVALGSKNYVPYQQQQGGRYSLDPDLGRYVAQVGHKIAKVSGRPGLPYDFVVLNNGVPNAWALPGGKIAINRGLLTLLEDEAQLAAVLAHEIVHAAGKHSVKQMQQAMILGIGAQATGMAARNTDYGSVLSVGTNLGAGLWSAKYGRDHELEADKYSLDYMAKAGYNPYAAVELQESFVRLSQQQGRQSNWVEGLFATHPPSHERAAKNKEKANTIGNVGVRNREAYQRAIAQLKKDKAAYDNHQKAIKAASEKKYKEALSLVEKSIKQQGQEALFYTTKGQILLTQKLDSRAAKAFTKAVSINPDYYLGHLGLGLIEKKQKRLVPAKQNLLKSTQLLSTQIATYHLGEIELADGNRDAAIRYFSAAARQGGELGKQAQAHLNRLQPATPQ